MVAQENDKIVGAGCRPFRRANRRGPVPRKAAFVPARRAPARCPGRPRLSECDGLRFGSVSGWATNFPPANRLDRRAKLLDGNGVVEPGIVHRVSQFLAQHGQQFAAAIDQCSARAARIVRLHVEHVDRAAIRRFERPAPGLQLGNRRDNAVLHACRLVARPR